MKAIEFIDRYKAAGFKLSEELRARLRDDELRGEIYKLIPFKAVVSFHGLLRTLFDFEVNYRNDERKDGEFFENIYHCAFLLFTIGDLNDVMTMWEARKSNFDLGCGFDIEFLVGAGIEETIAYLSRNKKTNSHRALEHIKRCRAAGDFDFLEEWIDDKKSYFGIIA